MDTVSEINFGYSISFKDSTYNYGRAEFVLCPVARRGKIIDLYITTQQQEPSASWHLSLRGENYTSIWYSSYGKLEDAKIWMQVWCKEHKALSVKLYVPSGSSRLEITSIFGDTIHLSFY